jgi:hypothetical protein
MYAGTIKEATRKTTAKINAFLFIKITYILFLCRGYKLHGVPHMVTEKECSDWFKAVSLPLRPRLPRSARFEV